MGSEAHTKNHMIRNFVHRRPYDALQFEKTVNEEREGMLYGERVLLRPVTEFDLERLLEFSGDPEINLAARVANR